MSDSSFGLALSSQEQRVLQLSMSGLADKEIAARLSISPDTVRTYWDRIRRKTGGVTRAAIIATHVTETSSHALRDMERRNAELHVEIERSADAETRLRGFADSVIEILWIADKQGNVEFANQNFKTFFGMEVPAGVEQLVEVIHPADVRQSLEGIRHGTARGRAFSNEIRLKRADGAYRWHYCRATPSFDATGGVRRWFYACRDIHDSLDTALPDMNPEGAMASLQRQALTGFWVYSHRTRQTRWSKNLFTILGLPGSAAVPSAAQVWRRVHVEDRERLRAEAKNDPGQGDYLEGRMLRDDGAIRQIGCWRYRRERNDGTLITAGVVQDVTELRNEGRLVGSHSRVIRDSHDIVVQYGDDLEVIWLNGAARRTLGILPATPAIGLRLCNFFPTTVWQRIGPSVESAGEAGGCVFEAPVIDAHGNALWMLATIHVDAGPQPRVHTAVLHDITEFKRRADHMTAIERLYRALLNQSGTFLLAWNLDGQVQTLNVAARKRLGYDPGDALTGEPILAVFDVASLEEAWSFLASKRRCEPGRGLELLREIAMTEPPPSLEWRLIGKGDRLVPIRLRLAPLRSEEGELLGFSATEVRDVDDPLR